MATLIIKPFLQKENDSIGLSEYGFAAFPGSKTYIEVPALYGKYLTGFDADAFYLDKLDERKFLDFSGILTLAVHYLENDPYIVKQIQKQFKLPLITW